MSTTARAAIQGALKLIGVLDPAETMSPEDAADGLESINDLVDAWNLERLNIYTITTVSATVTGASATIGPAMQIATPRPVRIESAYYRQGGFDTSIMVVDKQAYDAITDKTASGNPEVLYYDRNSPTGIVYFWPVPTALDIKLSVQAQFTAFADLDEVHTLPQGYSMALKYELAPLMALLHQRDVPTQVELTRRRLMRAIRHANVIVPTLQLDLPGNSANGHGRMNILTGQ